MWGAARRQWSNDIRWRFVFSDKPTTPTLTSSNSDPTDGDSITLTCTATEAAVDGYEFKLDGATVTSGSSNTLLIGSGTATIGTHDGSYTCIASIDTVSSDASSALDVNRE